MLIPGALAGNPEYMNAVMADSINPDFGRIGSGEDLYSCSGKFHLEIMERGCRKRPEMMQVTYRALGNLMLSE